MAATRQNDLCDTVTRWELTPRRGNAQPTWINWTGGDTLWSVAVTTSQRFTLAVTSAGSTTSGCNNEACPGSVEREGIAAVSPVDGSGSRPGTLAAAVEWERRN